MSEHEELPDLGQCRVDGCTNIVLETGGALKQSPVPVLICTKCLEAFRSAPPELGMALAVCMQCETIHFAFDPRRRNVTRFLSPLVPVHEKLSHRTYYMDKCPSCASEVKPSRVTLMAHFVFIKHFGGTSNECTE